MKRTSKPVVLFLIPACVLVLLLSVAHGIRGEQQQSNTPPVAASNQASLLDAVATSNEASLLDIANDYLSDEPKLTDLYEVGYDGWVKLNTSGEQFKPGAVYPYETWTTDEIIASYSEASAPWTGNYSTHHLWSTDYTHVFTIKDHIRCYIDGEYVGAVPHRQYSMDPNDLIQLYQSGEWDGEELLWSEDDSTYVTVQWRGPDTIDRHRNGCLRYQFINFTEEVGVRPWWDNDDSYELEPYYMAYTMAGEGEDAFLKYDEVLVPLYVDLPNGELTDRQTFGEVLQIVPCSREQGVLVYTTKGIWLFKAGDLVLGWPSADAAELLELGYQ